MDVYAYGRYPKAAFKYLEGQGVAPVFKEGDAELMKAAAQVDFMGVNYYQTAVIEYNPIDGVGMSEMNTIGKKGTVQSENGLGAFDKKTEDNKIHDDYRIEYLRAHIEELKEAVNEGFEVLAYCTWSITDLLSWLNGYQKRYGFIYVDHEEEGASINCYKKDSYYWYQNVIKTNGE